MDPVSDPAFQALLDAMPNKMTPAERRRVSFCVLRGSDLIESPSRLQRRRPKSESASDLPNSGTLPFRTKQQGMIVAPRPTVSPLPVPKPFLGILLYPGLIQKRLFEYLSLADIMFVIPCIC